MPRFNKTFEREHRDLFPKEKELTPEEEAVREEYNRRAEQKIQLEDFADAYPAEEINKDRQELERVQRKHGEKTERAALSEQIIPEQIETANWLGEDCTVLKTSEYDDVFNHIDFVGEFEGKEGETVRLGFDVTTSSEPAEITAKLESIREEIGRGTLGRLKYFISGREPEKKGRMGLIPRVIIEIDAEQITNLCGILERGIRRKGEPLEDFNKRSKGFSQELANHPIQIEIIKQIKSQLEEQIEFIKERAPRQSHLISLIQKPLNIVEKILVEKTS